MKRPLLWVSGGVVLCAAILLYVLSRAGLWLAIPDQPPEKSDLIVALGGDVGNRVDKTAELYHQGYAPKILLTGLDGGHDANRGHYLRWRAQFLLDRKVPKTALLFDEQSASSWEEANALRRLMLEQKMRRVLVVSDTPHLRRLDWVFRRVFAGSGLEYRLIAAPSSRWNAASWWRDEISAQYVIMEYTKLAYYWFAH